MARDVILEVFTAEEAAEFLRPRPETTRGIIASGEVKARSECQIPGPALSRWWRSRGGEPAFLDDWTRQAPWLPVILTRAAEAFHGRARARVWLVRPRHALANETPLEAARTSDGAAEVLALLGRVGDCTPG